MFDLETITYLWVFATGAIGGITKFCHSKREYRLRVVVATVLVGSITACCAVGLLFATISFFTKEWIEIYPYRQFCAAAGAGFGFIQPSIAGLFEAALKTMGYTKIKLDDPDK